MNFCPNKIQINGSKTQVSQKVKRYQEKFQEEIQ